jgi:uncharacterized protein
MLSFNPQNLQADCGPRDPSRRLRHLESDVFCLKLYTLARLICFALVGFVSDVYFVIGVSACGVTLFEEMVYWFVVNFIFASYCVIQIVAQHVIPNVRPIASNRTFTSVSIDNLIKDLDGSWKSQDLSTLFGNCFPNTLDTTVAIHRGKDDTFVITGDIYAMWLRDSTNQVLPYIPYAASEEKLDDMIQGLISRQAKSILIDSFANAFNPNSSGEGDSDAHQDDIRKPPMQPAVFEGKYEIDSIAAFLKLSHYYFTFTNNPTFATKSSNWIDAAERVVDTMSIMQHIGQDAAGDTQPYSFQRETTVATDTLEMTGLGPAGHQGIGLSRSLFRPSDDAVSFPYNVPGNAMACTELGNLVKLLANEDIASAIGHSRAADVRKKATTVKSSICQALEHINRSLVQELRRKDDGSRDVDTTMGVLPYEIDGFGSRLYMDDANIPSLLSLPILGYSAIDDQVYLTTRKRLLSSSNPFYFEGRDGSGIGGPHVGYQYAWPMSIIVRSMTSNDDDEIRECLNQLVGVSATTGLMHESFNVHNSSDFTRPWFAWANGLFGEMMLQLVSTKPHLVLKNDLDIIKKAQALVSPTVSLMALLDAEKKSSNN